MKLVITGGKKYVNTSSVTVLNTTNGYLGIDVIKNDLNNLIIDAPGYALLNTNQTANTSIPPLLNFSIQPTNSVTINIIDELTQATIFDIINMQLVSTNNVYNFTTNTGNIFISNITANDYQITFVDSNGTYSQRTYDLLILNRTTTTLTARLLSQNQTSQIGIFLKNSINQPIPNGMLTIEKNYAGNWLTVISTQMDVNGFTFINVQQGSTYRVTLADTGFQTTQYLLHNGQHNRHDENIHMQ